MKIDTNTFEKCGRVLGSALEYTHSDMIGTLKTTSDSVGAYTANRVFTAFGEDVTTNTDRYGYVGDWGYQSHAEMPYQHVGARYYDPGSGRFLQRDPIGIRGGFNVYSYVFNVPTIWIDPDGEFIFSIGAIVIGIVSGVAIAVQATTAYFNYRSAQHAAYASQPGKPRTIDETINSNRSRGRSLRNSGNHVADFITNMPGSSFTGSPTPSENAAEGVVEVGLGCLGLLD